MQKHGNTETWKHAHTDAHTDEYSIVAFCKNESIITNIFHPENLKVVSTLDLYKEIGFSKEFVILRCHVSRHINNTDLVEAALQSQHFNKSTG